MMKYDSGPLNFSPSILLLLLLLFLLLSLFTMRMYDSVVCFFARTSVISLIFNHERVTIACYHAVVTVRPHRGTVGLFRLITAAMDR